MTPEDLERTATALRNAYAEMRTFYSRRGTYRSRPDNNKHWMRIAPELLKRGIHPQHFVKTTFEYHLYQLRKPAAWVTEVASMNAVERYMEQHDLRNEELQLLLKLQLNTVEVQLRNGRTMEDIIKDTTLALNAVVRYALAQQAGLAELTEELRIDAELDISYEPLYQRFVRQLAGSAEQ